MRFADIPGHDEVKARLRSMADTHRLPHALMLEGPAGIGKFALARAFAQYIHCQHPVNGDSCGECPSCRQHESFNHIDTLYSYPYVKREGGGATYAEDYIEDFRNFLSDSPYMDLEAWMTALGKVNSQPVIYVDEANALINKLQYTAHSSKYRIVLMWLPERLHESAANKLLKLIEEPHEDTLFIFTSNSPGDVLATIYSRTQRIAVKPYTQEQLRACLVDQYQVDDAGAVQISRLARGSINEAIKLLSVSKQRKLYLDMFKELMRMAYTRNVAALKRWAEETSALGREGQMQFYDYCARMIRENFILNLHIDELNALTPDEMEFSKRFSPFINHRNVLKLVDVINDARTDIAANGNQKIINFDVAIKTILLLKQ